MKSNTKRQIIVLVAAFIGMIEAAHAFYDPGLQRWLNRDPIEQEGGINLYEFALSTPLNEIDALGLDVCIVQSTGFPYHQWFVGQNPDGTYWDASLYRNNKKERGIAGPGKVTFNPNSGFDPTKLGDDVKLARNMKTSPAVDAKVKAEALKRSDPKNWPSYDLIGHNCQQWADDMYHFAAGAQIRDNILKKIEKGKKVKTK